ncbi:MAG: hypothetical protein ACK4R7_05880, partial [Fervidobacterium sp.]
MKGKPNVISNIRTFSNYAKMESKKSGEMKNSYNRSKELYYTLLHILSALLLIILFIVMSNSYINSWQTDMEKVFESFKDSLVYPSWTLNKNLIGMILNTMINKTSIISIVVYDDKG